MSATVPATVTVPDLPAPGDAELVERFVVARDQAAFAELVHRHSAVVLGVCRRVLSDANDIDDVFQATFLVLVRDAKRVRKRSSLASWLYGVAYRIALRAARTRQRRRETELVDHKLIDDDAFGKIASLHDQQVLDAELNALSDRYRQPLVLRYLVGKSPSEVATELGITVGAVEGLLKRGKAELRQRLIRRGVTLGSTLGAVLVAIQFTQQSAQAAQQGLLIESTIQAGLAWSSGTNLPINDLVSSRAIELASKEIIAMTATTKTTLVIGLTVSGLIAGMGGAALLNGGTDGRAEAAGFNTAISTVHAAVAATEVAGVVVDPNPITAPDKPDTSGSTAIDENPITAPAKPESGGSAASADNVAPAPKKAVVQGPDGDSAKKWDFKQRTPREQAIQKAMKSLTEVQFTGIPLRDAIDFLKGTLEIEILFDHKALSEEGHSQDQEVSLVVSNVSAKSILRLLLEPIGLDYVTKNENLMITTITEAQNTFDTRVYDLRRVEMVTPENLMSLIAETVVPGRWQPVAKKDNEPAATNAATPNAAVTAGSIRVVGRTLVIRQTQRAHEEIVDLLNQLEQGSEELRKPVKR